jgi:hypothetical protein
MRAMIALIRASSFGVENEDGLFAAGHNAGFAVASGAVGIVAAMEGRGCSARLIAVPLQVSMTAAIHADLRIESPNF